LGRNPMKHRQFLIGMALCSTSIFAVDEAKIGSVAGTAVMVSNGESAVVPGAQVKLSGTASFEAQTDAIGNYSFAALPAGVYQIDIKSDGLAGTKTITVAAGETVDPQVKLELEDVKYSVDVSAEAPAGITALSVGQDVLRNETVRSAPN